MSTHLTPLNVTECLVAPIGELGELAGLNTKAAYNWASGSAWREAGDIPHRALRNIHKHAQKNGIPLSLRHLVYGADWHEIAQLVEGMGKTMPAKLRNRLKPCAASDMAAE